MSERARCVEHGLILAEDGTCLRCTRTRERAMTRRAFGIAVGALVAIVLVISFARALAQVVRPSLARAPSTSGETTANANANAGALVVYTTATCPHCRRAKAGLDERGVAYVERRIDEDPAAQRELAAKSGRVLVPTFVIDDDVQAGMDPQGVLVDRLLKKHGLR